MEAVFMSFDKIYLNLLSVACCFSANVFFSEFMPSHCDSSVDAGEAVIGKYGNSSWCGVLETELHAALYS
jgi:hypothetical protein